MAIAEWAVLWFFMNKYLTICAEHWSDEFNYMVC